VVQKRKGKIRPKFIADHHLAAELIEIFSNFRGRSYKELQEELRLREGKNFKVVRGLSILLERECKFQPKTTLDSRKVRTYLFDHGLVLNEEERRTVIQEAATVFKVAPTEIEAAMFGDLQEELDLVEFTPPSPERLIRTYNLALIQTLLFDAVNFRFKVSENWQQIFRQIKFLGLMYELNEQVEVTGAAGLFKNIKKYGTAFAKLVPAVLKSREWEIEAQITTLIGNEPRIYTFQLNSQEEIPLPKVQGKPPQFDSEVEARFFREFQALHTHWEIRREPEVIKAGLYAFIPDFGFYYKDLKYFLEIVGFWTPEYLNKKITKIRETQVPLIIAVNEKLNCHKEDFKGDVILYKNHVPTEPILKILQKLEEHVVKEEVKTLKSIEITEDIVSLEQKARELNVLPETLRQISFLNHKIIGEMIVSQDLLEKVRKELHPHQPYSQVEQILKKYHLTMRVLSVLGYKIVWKGLHPSKIIKT